MYIHKPIPTKSECYIQCIHSVPYWHGCIEVEVLYKLISEGILHMYMYSGWHHSDMCAVNSGLLVPFVHCTLQLLTHWSAESGVLIVIEIHVRFRGSNSFNPVSDCSVQTGCKYANRTRNPEMTVSCKQCFPLRGIQLLWNVTWNAH